MARDRAESTEGSVKSAKRRLALAIVALVFGVVVMVVAVIERNYWVAASVVLLSVTQLSVIRPALAVLKAARTGQQQ